MTCFQCRHSMGISWHRADLYCRLHMRRCDGVCSKFEREAGTDEPDGTQ